MINEVIEVNDAVTIYESTSHMLMSLKKCPKMYFRGELTFIAVETYLNGYIRGLEYCLNINIFSNIRVWFEEKVNKKNVSLGFSTHVDFYYKGNSEEERINILIDLVDEFFRYILKDKSVE